jgi:DNA-binding HxlR family transcriptional regulator
MEAAGLVDRDVREQVPPHVEYSLTPLGRTLERRLVAICEWQWKHLDELRQARARHSRARL